MGGRRHWRLLVIGLLLASCQLAGCAGRGGGVKAEPVEEQPPPLTGAGVELLSAPSEFLALVGSQPRTPSAYPEEDRIKHGKDFSQLLLHRNVGMSNENAKFSTQWSETQGQAPANLGIAVYDFEVPGYSHDHEVRYGWDDPPDDITTAWVGLSNYDRDAWDWFRCNASGLIVLPSMSPYLDPAAHVFAVFVLANAEVSSLRYVHLGQPLLTAELQASPRLGIVPVDVSFDGAGSATTAGTIDLYEWDLDDDGSYELSGTDPEQNFKYQFEGIYDPVLRVTSSYGQQATDSRTITAYDAWQHTWGGDGGDEIASLAVADYEFIYAVGETLSFGPGMTSALILKYDLTGNLIWARAWGVEKTDRFNHVAVDGNGDLIVVGETYETGPRGSDALLQKWDADGNLLYSYAWGGSEFDEAVAVAVASDMIYLAGDTESFGAGGRDVLLLQFDLGGNLQWPRVWGGADSDVAWDIGTHRTLLGTVSVYIAGSTYSYGAGERDVLYLRYLDDGTLTTQRCWGDGNWQVGRSISVSGMFTTDIFIGGHTGGYIDRDVLLLEVGSGPGLVAKTWGSDTIDEAYGILRVGSSLVLGGGTRSFTASTDGLFVSFGLDGTFTSASIWGTPDEDEWLNCLHSYPGSGILLGGEALAAQDGAWSTVVGTVADAGGNWQDLAGLTDEPLTTIESKSGTVTEITTAVVDTGGGLADALLMAREFQ